MGTDQNGVVRISNSVAADPMAGYRTLGRFLAVGVAAGGVIGGFVGGLAAWSPSSDLAVGGLSVGAAVGIVVGLLTQAATFVLVLAARAIRPSLARTTSVAVGAGAPLAAVAYVSSWVAGTAPYDASRSLVLVGGAIALATGTVLLSVRWCVFPLTDAVEARARSSPGASLSYSPRDDAPVGSERDVPARVALFFGWAESPLWYRTTVDVGPVDLSTLPLSAGLRQRLDAWNTFAGRILSAHDLEWPDARTEAEFTAAGATLARDLREELDIEVIYTPDGDVDIPMPPPSQLPGSRETDGWYASAPLSGETFPPQRLPEPSDEE